MTEKAVLIHCCCAHCAAYTIEYWQKQRYKTSLYWYNPNIHPFKEYQERLESMKILAEKYNLLLIVNESYDIASFLDRIVSNGEERCQYCFELRLGRTAKEARKRGFRYFTTTLIISPHQKHNLFRKIGNKLTDESLNSFLYVDLRKRYSDSRHITKPMELYRQKYCGCIYSKWERFFKSKRIDNS